MDVQCLSPLLVLGGCLGMFVVILRIVNRRHRAATMRSGSRMRLKSLVQRKRRTTSVDAKYKATRLTEILLGSLSTAGGLYIMTSSYFLRRPFLSWKSDVETDFPPENASILVIFMSLGRFCFSFFHRVEMESFGPFALWSAVRIVYLMVVVLVTTVVMATEENLFAGGAVLLMEADMVMEELCQVMETDCIVESSPRTKILLSVFGCLVSIATRVLFLPGYLFVLSFHLGYGPLEMSSVSVAVFSFTAIFFVAYFPLMVRFQVSRIQRIRQISGYNASLVEETRSTGTKGSMEERGLVSYQPVRGAEQCNGLRYRLRRARNREKIIKLLLCHAHRFDPRVSTTSSTGKLSTPSSSTGNSYVTYVNSSVLSVPSPSVILHARGILLLSGKRRTGK